MTDSSCVFVATGSADADAVPAPGARRAAHERFEQPSGAVERAGQALQAPADIDEVDDDHVDGCGHEHRRDAVSDLRRRPVAVGDRRDLGRTAMRRWSRRSRRR
jgi:hypothetical protein